MAEDIDDLLRRTMKTLDSQVPSGYFEDLPQRTLGRLEDSLMHSGSEEESALGDFDAASAAPLPDEDSGLHDIRSLARSTKQRISSRKIPQINSSSSASASDDDVIANSSSGWKAVALPEPAKMISLPDLSDLPPLPKLAEASAVEIPDVTPIDARVRARNAGASTSKRNRTIAGIGVAFAAAAGLVLFVATRKSGDSNTGDLQQPASRGLVEGAGPSSVAPTGGANTTAPPAAPTVRGNRPESQIATDHVGTKGAIGGGDGGAPGTGAGSTANEVAATPDAATEETKNGKLEIQHVEKVDETKVPSIPATKDMVTKTKSSGKKSSKSFTVGKPLGKTGVIDPDSSPTDATLKPTVDDKPPKKVLKDDSKQGPKPGPKTKDNELDDLLKDASGVEKKPVKPVLANKSLSADDFKSGMSAVAGKASGCYKGTPGSVAVNISIGPDGKVKNVAVKGSFAGTPSGDCVAAAVRGASFPPWDGPPQSFGYSFLLSE